MKVVNQSAHILTPRSPMKHIEKIGRICYKSEDKITDGTDRKFVKMLFNNKHYAMLEHYRFIVRVNEAIYSILSKSTPRHIEFSSYNDRFIISFNARALLELVENCSTKYGYSEHVMSNIRDELITHIVKEYDCPELFGLERGGKPLTMLSFGVEFIANSPNVMSKEEWNTHGWFSAHMITDRGISHEIVRHREETSFAQESTRYCNYAHDKFSKEITVIDQGFNGDEHTTWYSTVLDCEKSYFTLVDGGATPQFARSVLPTCLKTEIVMTAPIYEWNHFFNLRMRGTTGAPHPLMKDLATMVYHEYYIEFGGSQND